MSLKETKTNSSSLLFGSQFSGFGGFSTFGNFSDQNFDQVPSLNQFSQVSFPADE